MCGRWDSSVRRTTKSSKRSEKRRNRDRESGARCRVFGSAPLVCWWTMNDRLAKERKETDEILREALRLGIEIKRNPSWWWEDMDNFGGSLDDWEYVNDDFTYLTEIGKSGARRTIENQICQPCWSAWLQKQSQIINHYGLDLSDPDAQNFLFDNIKGFLFGETPQLAQIDTSKEGTVKW